MSDFRSVDAGIRSRCAAARLMAFAFSGDAAPAATIAFGGDATPAATIAFAWLLEREYHLAAPKIVRFA